MPVSKMHVPFVNLSAQYHKIQTEIANAIQSVLDDNAFIRGRYVEKFEENFAEYCHASHCLGVGNGTDALFIALKSVGIGNGDEVIVPANTFVATSEAISMTGATVVFTDIDPATFNLDTNLIEEKISKKTKAIIPVHLYGQPSDLEKIKSIAVENNLKLIQDCAQSHGAKINDLPLSNYGDILCFSFYPGKNLGAYGDAGAIVTDDQRLAEKAKMFSNHGRVEKYDHEIEGFNSRMDGLQGAILDVKLRYLEDWTIARQENALKYNRFLEGLDDVIVPFVKPGNRHVYHLYVIKTKERDRLQKYLKENGIATGIHYPIALPNLTAYCHLGHTTDDFPVASRLQEEILSLPMYPELEDDMIAYVAEKVRNYFE